LNNHLSKSIKEKMAGNNLDLYNKNSGGKKNSFNIISMFSTLTMAQKISIGLIAVIMIVGIFVVYKWSSRPEYVVLYSNLAAEDTAAIVEQLDGANIKYQVSSDGATVQVDQKQLSSARLLLAEQGLPATSTVGFELFDKQFFGLTDFAQKVNYQRALEGELSKTISSIEEVESVRIHLVLSESEVFSETATPATASIVLKIKKGKELKSSNITAITNFVAGSVQGLKKENITIVDTKGTLLTSGNVAEGETTDKSGMVSLFEDDIEKDLSFMLAQVYGADNVLVRVSADINFDKKESQLETYIPKEDGKGVIISESVVRETYDKSTAGSNTGTSASGTDANVPNATDTTTTTPSYAENNGTSSTGTDIAGNTYLKDETTTQYALSKKIETINTQGGNLEKMSIGIFINGNLTEEEKNNIKAVVSAASGIITERGDTLSIEGVSFAALEDNMVSSDDTAAVVPLTDQLLPMLQKYFPGIILLLVLGFLTLRAFKNNSPNPKGKYLNYSPKSIGNDYGAGSLQSNFAASTISERNDTTGFADSNIPKSGKASQEQIKNRLMDINKSAGENKPKKANQEMEDYVPPEALMGKFSKLRELVGDGVDVNPDTARKIIKNWVDVGR
jgi:flagellar M-ring protein FliF